MPGVELWKAAAYPIRLTANTLIAAPIKTLYEKMLPPDAVPEVFKAKFAERIVQFLRNALHCVGLLSQGLQGLVRNSFFRFKNGLPKKPVDGNPLHPASASGPFIARPSLAPAPVAALTLCIVRISRPAAQLLGRRQGFRGNYIRGGKCSEVKRKRVAQILMDRVEAQYPDSQAARAVL